MESENVGQLREIQKRRKHNTTDATNLSSCLWYSFIEPCTTCRTKMANGEIGVWQHLYVWALCLSTLLWTLALALSAFLSLSLYLLLTDTGCPPASNCQGGHGQVHRWQYLSLGICNRYLCVFCVFVRVTFSLTRKHATNLSRCSSQLVDKKLVLSTVGWYPKTPYSSLSII